MVRQRPLKSPSAGSTPASPSSRRVLAEYVETWDGGHGYPGFCVCEVVEEEGKPIRVERGKAMYLREMPEMRDWIEIFNRASSNLRARAWYEATRKRKAA